jgi:hypothetical protein
VDEPLVEELGYRRPTFEEATEYFKIKHSNVRVQAMVVSINLS